MAKNNALMRNLPAVETLGSTTVVCSDKTGTLTKDQMTVRKMFVDGKLVEVTGSGYQPEGRFLADGDEIQPLPGLELLLSAGSLASDAALNCDAGTWHAAGDPSEAALVTVAAKAGLDKTVLEREQPRVAEIPFSSERKRMTTLHSRSGVTTAYCKGAPEVILADCDRQRLENRELPLTDQSRHAILEVGRTLASEALRILAVAYKPAARVDDAETGMVFLGLLGLMDPPREEAAAAIRTCHEAGIRPIMITGDHPDTGAAIARELGLLTDGRILTGAELQTMTNAELERDVDKIEVYARVSPEQKIRVVDAWQRHGAVVAVTGDGINDAPALKKADIGIAMGITGTDVSREAADMTLIDDNFASIISAIAEGRRIFSNIKKFLMYLLSANIGEIGLMAMAAFAGLPLPLTAVQILYVNLATDGFPALALAVDPPAPGLMRRRPRDPRRSIFTRPVVTLMLVGGSWSACANFALFNVVLRSGRPVEEAMALTFISLVLIQLFQVYNFRSDRRSVIESPFGNRWLNLAVLGDLVLLGLIVYVPLLHEPLGTFTLNGTDWLLVIGVASTVVPALELTKLFIRKGMAGSLD
jgi:Ca2+-transporting ATPase